MKLHKIRGIALTVCACEQKIAYNYAFSNVDFSFNDAVELVKNDLNRRKDGDMKKYDTDAILKIFEENFKNYNGEIGCSYEKIGELFPVGA